MKSIPHPGTAACLPPGHILMARFLLACLLLMLPLAAVVAAEGWEDIEGRWTLNHRELPASVHDPHGACW